MVFQTEETLTEAQLKEGLSNVIRDGVTSQTMTILTGGAFLTAFAIKLGASNFTIGILAAIGPLSQLIQLPSIFLVEKYRKRRAITVIAAALSRLFLLVIALIPFIFSARTGVTVLIISLMASSAFGAVSGCSWNSWMHDLIPHEILGKFFSKRMRIATAAGIILSFAAAGYLDLWKKFFDKYELQGYSLLFLAGFAAGTLGLYFLAKTPEPTMHGKLEKRSITHLLFLPFKDENFRKLITFLCSWNFAVNLAGPFFMVYMLKRLGLSISFVIGLSILSQVANFAFLKIWGRYTDRFSNKSVLAICGPLFILSIFAWTFTTMPEKYILTIPLLLFIHLVMGVSSAGISLASGNISLKLAPKGQATAYLAANTFVNSIAAGIAPVVGGRFVDSFSGHEIAGTIRYTAPTGEFAIPTLNLQQWDFLFFFAFLIGLYSIHRLSMIKETGEVKEKIVLIELFAEVRNQARILSSIEGLRQMVTFPFNILRNFTSQNKQQ